MPATNPDLREQRAWSFESSYLDILTLEEFLDGCAGLEYRLDVNTPRHPFDFTTYHVVAHFANHI